MNRLMITGNLTRDPETRVTPGGDTVCNFTVAVNRRRREGDDADFFRVNAWKKLGESCQACLAKGKKVAVIGSVQVDSYTSSNGEHRAVMVVNADDVEFLSPKAEAAAVAANLSKYATPAPKPQYVEVTDENLPWE